MKPKNPQFLVGKQDQKSDSAEVALLRVMSNVFMFPFVTSNLFPSFTFPLVHFSPYDHFLFLSFFFFFFPAIPGKLPRCTPHDSQPKQWNHEQRRWLNGANRRDKELHHTEDFGNDAFSESQQFSGKHTLSAALRDLNSTQSGVKTPIMFILYTQDLCAWHRKCVCTFILWHAKKRACARVCRVKKKKSVWSSARMCV